MTASNLHVAFLGVGLMGAPMVRNLLATGFSMTLWNRTTSKCEPFKDQGGFAGSRILDEARAEGLTLPLAQQVHNEYLGLIANGHSEADHSGLLLELEHQNGVLLGSSVNRQ